MANKFKLPKSGFDVISKILHAYAASGDQEVSLADLNRRSGLNSTMLSSNNGFLISIHAIEGGKKKKFTTIGKNLAMAIANGQEQEARKYWAHLFTECDETRNAIEMIKVQNGIPKEQFNGKLATTFGVVADTSRTGLNSIADILEHAQLIYEVDGKYLANGDTLEAPPEPENVVANPVEVTSNETMDNPLPEPMSTSSTTEKLKNTVPEVHINVQVHISPESSPEQIEKIFESMAKYLNPNQ